MSYSGIDRRLALALLGAGVVSPTVFSSGAARAAQARQETEHVPEADFGPEEGDTHLTGMQDQQRRMTAPVMIDGQGPFDFVVDTGANRSVISTQLAERLGLPEGKPTIVHGITGEKRAATAKVKKFSFGGRTASNLSMAVLNLAPLGAIGLLGVDGLKNQKVTFDLPGSRLQIVRSGERMNASAGGVVIPARRRFGQLTVVDTDLDGTRVSVLIDSGSESTVGNTALRRVVTSRPRSAELQQVVLTGATGDTTVADFGPVPRFRLGALTIENLRVAYADLHPFKLWDLTDRPAMLMGMDIMRFFEEVALDYGRSEVRFLLPKTPYIDPAGAPRRT